MCRPRSAWRWREKPSGAAENLFRCPRCSAMSTSPAGRDLTMLRRIGFIVTAIVLLSCSAATAQPKPVALWHVFNLETDMIHGGIKSFNETQTAHRLDARLVPAN